MPDIAIRNCDAPRNEVKASTARYLTELHGTTDAAKVPYMIYCRRRRDGEGRVVDYHAIRGHYTEARVGCINIQY